MVTLGISTNTRLVSIAIISQNELVEYFTHLHKAYWSPAKVNEIITSLEPCVRQYCIKKVILSIPYAYHQTKEHSRLTKELIRFFKKKKIAIYTKSPETFRLLYKGEKKAWKQEMRRKIAERFPELHICYRKELRNRNKYYYKLFEAVAAAIL